MSKQTINIGASPNDGTGTPLRTSFDYTNQNFTELYTAVGPSGNNIVVPGNATITGDLTVDTSTLKVDSGANKVGIGTTTMNGVLTVKNPNVNVDSSIYTIQAATSTSQLSSWTINQNTDVVSFGTDFFGALSLKTNSVERYNIGTTGISTWSVAGTTAMTLNSTGLGIGGSAASKLSITDTSPRINFVTTSGLDVTGYIYNAIDVGSGGKLVFGTKRNGDTALDRLTIDSAGNCGIGGAPSAWGSAFKAIQQVNYGASFFSSNAGPIGLASNCYNDGTNWLYSSNNAPTRYEFGVDAGNHRWFSAVAGTGTVAFGDAKMTLDASGTLFLGKTSSSSASTGCELQTGTGGNAASVFTADGAIVSIMNRLTSDGTIIDFRRQTSSVGNIAVTTLATTYNSISDYRLKEAVQPLVGGLARVSALKPSIYKWKVNGSDGEGFLAHELASVVSAAVTGEKDAVNEDGSINAQSIDMSRIVPILVAAIQELTARVQTLEAR